jgi:hypothetical protein
MALLSWCCVAPLAKNAHVAHGRIEKHVHRRDAEDAEKTVVIPAKAGIQRASVNKQPSRLKDQLVSVQK